MKKNAGFKKFFKGNAPTGAKKKEAIRQDKREVRKERQEGIDASKRFKRAQKKTAASGQPPKYNLEPPGSGGYKKTKPFGSTGSAGSSATASPKAGKPGYDRASKNKSGYGKASADKPAYAKARADKPAYAKASTGKPTYGTSSVGKPTYAKASANKPTYTKASADKRFAPQKGKPSYKKMASDDSPQSRQQRFAPQKAPGYKATGSQDKRFDEQRRNSSTPPQQRFAPKKSSARDDERQGQRKFDPKPRNVSRDAQSQRNSKPYGASRNEPQRGQSRFQSPRPERPLSERPKLERKPEPAPRPAGIKAPTISNKSNKDEMPLNKYIAHGGLCSRREAVDYIKGGKVKVNGELVLEPGHKVSINDDVRVGGRKMNPVKDFVYILLNKPKDYITTTDDPQERRTVLDLIQGIPDIRIYPVGRLDRNTSGVLLLTNDGDLSQSLTHPSNEITKVYAVTLDEPLTKAHFQDILKGVTLEDGPAYVDTLAFTDSQDATQIGVEIHTGRNRIVRRIFEHFGYDVKGLDRVVFAGLTKKNVNRGKWRYLSEKEVRDLKFFKKGKR